MLKYIAISALALLCACTQKDQKKHMSIPPTPAQLVQAQAGDVREYISTMGTTASVNSVNIVPEVSGKIVSINFEQGERVKKGDVLAVIDQRPYKAALMQAQGTLLQAQAQLKIDELSVERNRKLAKDGYVDKQTFDALIAKVEVDKGVVEAAKAALETAQINLDWCSVKAPVDGKAGFYNTNLGNFVAAGSTVLTTIENVDELYVDFVVPSQRLFDVMQVMNKNGGKIEVDVSYIEDDYSAKRTRKASVDTVLNKIRYESGTAVLRGRLGNSDGMFWPNQPVMVKVNLEEIDGSVLVPDICVQLNALGPYVYVASPVKDGVYKISMRQVQKGQLFGDMRAIRGVEPGAQVVLRVSQLRLQAGPFVYATTQNGEIIGADGKLVTTREGMAAFMAKAASVADELRAQAMRQSQKPSSPTADKDAGSGAAQK